MWEGRVIAGPGRDLAAIGVELHVAVDGGVHEVEEELQGGLLQRLVEVEALLVLGFPEGREVPVGQVLCALQRPVRDLKGYGLGLSL